MRKLLNRKIIEQDRKCAISLEEFTDYNDVVPDHKDPKGMGGACDDIQSQDGGRRLRPHGPHVRLRGVGQRHSTDESFEQRRNIVGGE